jgi:hypothetical protein
VWASLLSPVHVAHYAGDGTGIYRSPMRRLVGTLAARDYAPAVLAFTSLDLLTITFQPAYGDGFASDTIVLAFDSGSQLFEVTYNGFGKKDRTRFRCEEFEIGRLVDALVLWMQLSISE